MKNYVKIIANILMDYEYFDEVNHRKEEFLTNHVIKWAQQFSESERLDIIRITSHFLSNFYITKTTENQFLEEIFWVDKFTRDGTVPYFLNIQGNGQSQQSLVTRLTNLRVFKKLNIRNNQYLYIDDYIFSGGRVVQDVVPWLDRLSVDSHLYIAVIGWYKSGQYRIEQNLNRKIEEIKKIKKINITYSFIYKDAKWLLENTKFYRNYSENLWPKEILFDRPDLSTRKIDNVTYRAIFEPQKMFLNESDREFFEYISLKYGYLIMDKIQTINTRTRPLGSHFYDYGFGGLVFNYRNCPNNTPLIFWWGSIDLCHPMSSQWYPLMPRRTYSHG
ncbi:hypothetical protein F941_03036 [Acinetobacter bouvetii DSM 14964 = CIP 107468]|uniref:PRTase-CE domain-containing protein n=1 Tax=Acinetobacter bouvetii DSM 14964 = CIP 107468 TaxID=1120925 RepID=N9DLZ1_9GAMM|nr:hypothetical protein [Acinetobacter bouvetii]ENV81478.1 hypothetical protein F941_03036 [Acinetobacter bouvetii DSM 14964 = CIP 107468]BCU63540.1 hypothetical protein ACBO_03310 [Acinetobacter bouvetii]